MLYSRTVLALVGLFYVGFGIVGTVDPVAATGMTGVQLPTATALTDGRAIYGGLSVGWGIFLLMASAGVVAPRSGLWLLVLGNGFPILCRIYGIGFAGAATRGTVAALVPELIIVTAAGAGLLVGNVGENPRTA